MRRRNFLVGAATLGSGLRTFAQTPGARWVGILSAAGNGIIQLLVLPAAPFLAVTLFAVDMFIIYGLIAYGARQES